MIVKDRNTSTLGPMMSSCMAGTGTGQTLVMDADESTAHRRAKSKQ